MSGSNRKPSFYFTQKCFGGMAMLSADDQSVISKMRTSVSAAPATAFSISRASGMPGRCVRNPLPVQAGQSLFECSRSIQTVLPRQWR